MATKTKKKVDLFSTIMTIVLVLIIVGGIALFAFQTCEKSGVGLRSKIVVKSDNFEVNGAMMQYAVMTSYNNYLSQYEQYGLLDYLGIDTTKKLSAQQYSENQTWLDFFTEQAKATVEQMLVYAEAAKAAGFELNEEEQASVDSVISSFELMASYYGTSTNAYIASNYGQGVKAKDIRDFLAISTLAEQYSAKVADELKESIKAEDVEIFYGENKADYTQFDTISYSEKITIETAGKSDEEIAAAKEELKNALTRLTEAKTADEFKSILAEVKNITVENADQPEEATEDTTEEATEDTAEDTTEDTTEKTDEDKDDEKKEEEKSPLDNIVEATVTGSTVSGDIKEWIFETKDGELVRVAGEAKLFEENKENKGTGEEADKVKSHDYTVTVYLILSDAARDETITKDAGHILFKTDTYGSAEEALEAAQKVLSEYNTSDRTKESFEKIANENTEDSGVFYDNIKKGDMVTEFENWIYDSDRKVGDVDIVETEYGQHIMYFVGDGDAAWYVDCFNALFNKIAEDQYEEFKAAYEVKYSAKAAKAINC